MAVARVLGDPQTQQVNINSQFNANPAGVQISNSQSVEFNNNSGSTISILFAPTAISNQRVFNDITNLAKGQSVRKQRWLQTSQLTIRFGTGLRITDLLRSKWEPVRCKSP